MLCSLLVARPPISLVYVAPTYLSYFEERQLTSRIVWREVCSQGETLRSRIGFIINRIRERLWVRPLAFCLLSLGGVFLAKVPDFYNLGTSLPKIHPDSVEALLTVVASSMLVIATFAVGSMVSAYASAAVNATPRSFPLVVADDVSQNALSVFVGAFIFSLIALVALKNQYYEEAGHFSLFVLTLFVFAWVIVTFVRWVDTIARLGRLGTTIDKVEAATAKALQARLRDRNLGGVPVSESSADSSVISATEVGYLQHIDVAALQACAEKWSLRITVALLPGAFVTLDKPLGSYVSTDQGAPADVDLTSLASAFQIGESRVYEDDPRFGLIALSEIASRALSPAVNDPGTAIDVIGRLLRLFTEWGSAAKHADNEAEPQFDRIEIPEIEVSDMFDDAFSPIARDGAGTVEVQIRLQKALASLASVGNEDIETAAVRHSRLALKRARQALNLEEDIETVAKAAQWSKESSMPN